MRPVAERSVAGRGAGSALTAARTAVASRLLGASGEADVVVVDFAETYSVGPALAVAEGVGRRLTPAAGRAAVVRAGRRLRRAVRSAPVTALGLCGGTLASGALLALMETAALGTMGLWALALVLALTVLATRERRSAADLRETRPIQVALSVLEPPAPPADSRRED
ncbi:MAG: hypothetical protein ABEJ30_00410 [Halorientalis sp.]